VRLDAWLVLRSLLSTMATSLSLCRYGAAASLTFMALAMAQVDKGAKLEEYAISDSVSCVPNPPQDKMCKLTPELTEWLYDQVGSTLGVDEMKSAARKEFIKKWKASPCIGAGGAFYPLKRNAVNIPGTEYYLCTFQMKTRKGGKPFMIYNPSDDQDNMQECDIMPLLMRMATNGKGMAIDVGAGSSGDCTWPLLAEGHTVHMFEPGYEYTPDMGKDRRYYPERAFVRLTIEANNWQGRATIHGALMADKYVERLFKDTRRIHLLKIDVDGIPEYKAVFGGVEAILNRTDIVQLEMLTPEIGIKGKRWVIQHFESRGFETYGLEDVDTFPGRVHSSLSTRCTEVGLEEQLHPTNVSKGLVDYQYGQFGPWKMRMFPICQCTPTSAKITHNSRGTDSPVRCGDQFAFVNPKSDAFTNVANKYGSCKSLCAYRGLAPKHDQGHSKEPSKVDPSAQGTLAPKHDQGHAKEPSKVGPSAQGTIDQLQAQDPGVRKLENYMATLPGWGDLSLSNAEADL